MLESYLSPHYPEGQVRRARYSHICNGSLDGLDPGCGAQIMAGEDYFDTGQRDEKFRAGRFCKYCAMIGSRQPDLFPIADDGQMRRI